MKDIKKYFRELPGFSIKVEQFPDRCVYYFLSSIEPVGRTMTFADVAGADAYFMAMKKRITNWNDCIPQNEALASINRLIV